ncbi:MAG: bifunctional serine/threonine-protein kinase/formylglycine-generating enzyme family protein [Steroidobacteraceae bacterium]
MSSFANALRSFQHGDLTREQLLSEMYRELAVERVAPVKLLEILNEHKSRQPLPDDTHETLRSRITSWPQEETVATRSSRENSNIPGNDAPATIVLGETTDSLSGPRAVDARHPRARPVGVGSVLQGRFSLVALVGEGGMSRVFKAVDLRRVEAGAHDPYIAVKVLTVPFSHYFGSMAALQREAHKLQSLTHQNIVRVIDCDRDGQSVFMTMEYLPGESLYKRLRSGGADGLPREEALSIITGIAHALEYAHRNHIVHGDLKPGNVIVDDQCGVKVIDFGMARFIAKRSEAASTDREPTALTPRYASPQMLAGHPPEPADDVYALACLAYEVLTGRHPFGRVEDSPPRTPDLRPVRLSSLGRRTYRVLVRALEFERSRRTPTVAQFLKEFRAASRDRRSQWVIGGGVAAALLAAAAMIFLALAPPGLMQRLQGTATGARHAPTVLRDCPTCPLMSVVPAGHFMQGSSSDEAGATPFERPRHPMEIPKPFAMGVNEITVGEFKEFVDATGRQVHGCEVYSNDRWQLRAGASWMSPGFSQSPMHPVACVSFEDATAYVQWLSGRSGHRYRLPSASEWEFAARAGGEAQTAWGSNATLACGHGNVADQNALLLYPGWNAFECSDGYVATAPVGSFAANAYGLNDLYGNVFEWVQDCWSDDYSSAPRRGEASLSGDCRVREARGGSWFTPPAFVRAAYRNRFPTGLRSTVLGFRVVREMGR